MLNTLSYSLHCHGILALPVYCLLNTPVCWTHLSVEHTCLLNTPDEQLRNEGLGIVGWPQCSTCHGREVNQQKSVVSVLDPAGRGQQLAVVSLCNTDRIAANNGSTGMFHLWVLGSFVGVVVKASASREEDPGFDFHLRLGDFSVSSRTVT